MSEKNLQPPTSLSIWDISSYICYMKATNLMSSSDMFLINNILQLPYTTDTVQINHCWDNWHTINMMCIFI